VAGSGQTWIEVRIHVSRQFASQIESLLASLGALSITLTDQADNPVLEPAVGETPLWPEVFVTGLFDDQINPQAVRSMLNRAPGISTDGQILFLTLNDRDWERAWLDNFKPMKFGENLWIVPGGQQAPEPDANIIELDPGLAFGSGTHPTTRMCLEWLDAQALKGKIVIDFGCGSGVLGLAAALKGAQGVVCIDNDPQALLATRENAHRNRVGSIVRTTDCGQPGISCADVVVANILAGTLVDLAPALCLALKPGGNIALSGILKEQAGQVSSIYSQWLENIEQIKLEDWVLISGKRRERDT